MNDAVKGALEVITALQSLTKNPQALKDEVAALVDAYTKLKAENDRAGSIAQLAKAKADIVRLEERARQALDTANADAEDIRKKARAEADTYEGERKARLDVFENGVKLREDAVVRREPVVEAEAVRLGNLEKDLGVRESKVKARETAVAARAAELKAEMERAQEAVAAAAIKRAAVEEALKLAQA